MYEKIVKDIAHFNITGAEKITYWGVSAFLYKKRELDSKVQFISTYLVHLSKIKSELFSLRENEFSLHNALHYIFDKKRYAKAQSLAEVQKDVEQRIEHIFKHLEDALFKVSHIAEKKIKDSFVILTFGHSSFVVDVCNHCYGKKKFSVIVLEGGPEKKGIDFINELHKKIPVTYLSDTSVFDAIKKADIILLGATAINHSGDIVTQHGSKTIAVVAKELGVPIYIVTDSLKYAKEVIHKEDKPSEELWINPPKNVTIFNSSVSILSKNDVSYIISEKGILKPLDFIKAAKNSFL